MAAMLAIIELGGKQYLVKEKTILRVEKIEAEEGKSTDAEKVILVSDAGSTKIGTPYLKGAKVELKVLGAGKSDKVFVFKMKAKKRYKKGQGHRQLYTDVQVTKIQV
ncbi:MAG: 50S ribosomal protein L21 [Candidatus Peregrinibacteria bacterium GW2011_GWA2_47_7]|nr:MAG: 50S ribosomal protein L21 [Candidatus Peregrinibacteria bacterium GW2011_GWA2_47_7]